MAAPRAMACGAFFGLLLAQAQAGDAWTDAENPVRLLFKGQRLDLWSLRPIETPPIPELPPARRGWVRQPVDAFIAEKLAREGLAPAPEADRRTLARRLAYVLTGLPPDEAVLEAFLHDEAPDAFERLADSLLASPEFGVHWARMWLDTVRYSDSNGYDWDEFRPAAWRFRDYVARSFNEDKPFDRFIREQLAGDELAGGAPQNEQERDALIASGFLRLGPQDNSAPLFGEQDRERAAFEADLAETTGTAFLGLTLRCCRCHDHKTDPISQDDYYRLRAFFAGVTREDKMVIDLPDERAAIEHGQRETDARIAALEGGQAAVLQSAKVRLAAMHCGPPSDFSDKKALAALTADEKKEHRRLKEEIAAVRTQRPGFTHALGVSENRERPLPVPVLANGEISQPRHSVEPGLLTVFHREPADLTARGTRPASRRLALADWITAPENPLTARVIANRLWQQCFGEGLAATADDFGYTGAPPTHPGLLDWLAQQFRAEGWSVKKMVRLLVTSAAWRQSAWVADETARARGEAADTPNAWLWHARPRRLTAEQVRDSLLHAAGWLTGPPAGPPVWPELLPEVLQANPAFLDDNAEKTKGWYPSPPEQLRVRSLRLIQKRSVKIPFLETFDLPDNFEACTRRLEAAGAPQALTLLNHPWAAETAHAAAARIEAEVGKEPATQLHRAFMLLLQRPPTAEETAVCQSLLEQRGLAELCRVLFNTSEFLVVE